MAKKKSIQKTNRKGLTKAKWIEVIQCLFKVVSDKPPKIEFTPEGINVEWFTIAPAEWEEKGISGKLLRRGYEVIEWRSTGGSYHEPPETYEVHLDFEASPYEAIALIVKNIFNQQVSDCLEGFQMEDLQKEEEKYVEQMKELEKEQATGKESEEPNRDMYDDYRDRMERHNRQVLSRL